MLKCTTLEAYTSGGKKKLRLKSLALDCDVTSALKIDAGGSLHTDCDDTTNDGVDYVQVPQSTWSERIGRRIYLLC